MSRKNREALRQITDPAGYPAGTIIEEFRDGKEITYPGGRKEFVDVKGKLVLPVVSDKQLEAWKKMPKEQALNEAYELLRNQGMDVAEQRVKLEIIKFIAELQGATVPDRTGSKMPLIMIQVNAPGEPFCKPAIDVREAKPSSSP